jgi:glutamate---cysteine ligase / carboxylate-amine ligase
MTVCGSDYHGSRGTARRVGVEEEFLLVDTETGAPRAVSAAVLEASNEDREVGDGLSGELQREQVETGSTPCRTLSDLGADLRAARSAAAAAAREVGAALAPLGTSPLAVDPTLSPSPRYAEMGRRYGLTAAEQLTCGCHVHVSVDGPEEGVAALDRVRPWLAPLLALSANSPFWQGTDSGYVSFRSQLWARWPSAGPYSPFGSPRGYRTFVDAVLATDTVLDEGMLYLDARLSAAHPTVEVRVADICREPDDAVLIAALARGLVETAVREWRADRAPDPVRIEVLRLATWRAGRSGIGGELLDPMSWEPRPAAEVIGALVEHVGPALEEAGDLTTVRDLMKAVLERGPGAQRQREHLDRTGDMASVVRDAALQ